MYQSFSKTLENNMNLIKMQDKMQQIFL